MKVGVTILLLLFYSTSVASVDYGFVYPNATDPTQENLVLELGQTIDIKWRSPYNAIKLAFIAEDGPLYQFFSQGNTGNSFSWQVNVNNSGSSSPYYYLYFENEKDNTQHYYSALFRVDNPVNAESASTAAATVTVTPTPTLQASASANAGTTVFVTEAITASPTTASAAQSSGGTSVASAPGSSATGTGGQSTAGLSTGAKIGVGVGVSLGVIALLGLAFFAVCSSRRHSKAANRSSDVPRISNYSGDRYATDDIPLDEGAGYVHPSVYEQQGTKLTKLGPGTGQQGYAPIKQQPASELAGLHELPQNTIEPQELDTGNDGYHQNYRDYR